MAITKIKNIKGKIRYKSEPYHLGRLPSKTFHRKIDAEQWERDQIALAQSGKINSFHKVSLEAFFEQVYWPNKSIRESTATDYRRIYEKVLAPRFGHRSISEISSREWDMYFKDLVHQGKYTGARMNRVIAVTSAVYTLAIQYEYLDANPIRRIKKFKGNANSKKAWTQDEVDHFFNWCIETKSENYLIYRLILQTGLRISELIPLKNSKINWDNGTILIDETYSRSTMQEENTTKSGKARTVVVDQSLLAKLSGLSNQANSDYLFTKMDGSRVSYETVSRKFSKDQLDAKMKTRITLHELRHTFASLYLANGGSMFNLQKLMGHQSITTTELYSHHSPDFYLNEKGKVNLDHLDSENLVKLRDFTLDSRQDTKKPAT